MKEKSIFFFLLLNLFSFSVSSQSCLYNFRHTTLHTNSVFSSVSIYENMSYTVGVVADTVPYAYLGSEINIFDNLGNHVRSVLINDPNTRIESWGFSSAVDSEGNLYFTGYQNGVGREVFIGKYSIPGDSLIIKGFSNPFFPTANWFTGKGVKVVGNKVYLYGNMEKPEGGDENQGFVWLLDSSLEILQERVAIFPSPSTAAIDDITELPNGNILTLVREQERGEWCEPYVRFHLIEYTPDLLGNIRRYTPPINEVWDTYSGSLMATPTGDIYLHIRNVDYRNSLVGCISSLVPSSRVVKFNRDLERVWIRDFTRTVDFGGGYTSLAPIHSTQNGRFITTYNAQTLGDSTDMMIQSLAYVITFDADGTLHSREIHTGFPGDTLGTINQVSDMQATPDGGFVIVGQSIRDGRYMPGDTTDERLQRGWILKVDQEGKLFPTCDTLLDATNTNYTAGNSIKLFPNPTANVLHIEPEGNWLPRVTVRVLDAQGRLVSERLVRYVEGEVITHSVAGLRAGMYSLVLTDGVRQRGKRFIKQ